MAIDHNRRKFLITLPETLIGVGALPAFASPVQPGDNKTAYIYHAEYLEHILRSGHPESPKRLRAIERRMTATGLADRVKPVPLFLHPVPAIKRVHKQRHIDAVQSIPVTGDVSKMAVAGVLGAVQAVHQGVVQNAFCAIRPPGHHAGNSGMDEGFCFYNNAAIAAKYAQKVLNYKKVLVIDWDYHHGNTTEATFYRDPTVLFFSTHNKNAYPGTGDPSRQGEGAGHGYTINVHLPVWAKDADMFNAWEKQFLSRAEEFKPDFILISAGFDSRIDDKIGRFKISDICFARLTEMVMDIARTHCNGRLVSILEGGYNVEGLASAVTAHISKLLTY